VAFVAAPEESPAALDELHRGAGTRFDPRAVDALASVGSDLK
jgi:HD-GYP domain-containing protein (c-di-GMP phosphodiesterase class II)